MTSLSFQLPYRRTKRKVRGFDSVLGAGGPQNQKLNHVAPVTSSFHENLEGRSAGKYL